MQTDELIRELAAEGRPVRRLSPWVRRIAIWAAVSLASAAIVIGLGGVRRDFAAMLWNPAYAFEALLLAVTALSAAAGALIVSVPGAERSRFVRWLPILAGTAALLWVAGELAVVAAAGEPTGRVGIAWGCLSRTLAIGLVPGVVLFAMVGRGSPLRTAWAGLLALLATSAVGVLGTNIMCGVDRPTHLLFWHVGPMALIAAAGAGAGMAFLNWMNVRRS